MKDTKLRYGINHIEFWVSDLKGSVLFYNTFLSLIGWEKISSNSFSDGNMVIYFMEKKDKQKVDSLGIRHLCFQAIEKNQVDEMYKTLLNLNAKIIRDPILMPYSEGYYTVDFYDPDGQVLEVTYTP